MNKFLPFLVFIIAGFLFGPACRKKDSPAPPAPPTPSCHVLSVTDSVDPPNPPEISDFTYDDKGRLSSIHGKGPGFEVTNKCTYSGNIQFNTETEVDGTIYSTDSIVLNSDGLMISDLYTSGGHTMLYKYTYSGTQLTTQSIQEDNSPPYVTTYTYSNGDMVRSENKYTVKVYTYDPDRPVAQGDASQILQFIQFGAFYLKNAHMMISMQDSGETDTYEYTYDDSGKVTGYKLFIGSSLVDNTSFQYQCN